MPSKPAEKRPHVYVRNGFSFNPWGGEGLCCTASDSSHSGAVQPTSANILLETVMNPSSSDFMQPAHFHCTAHESPCPDKDFGQAWFRVSSAVLELKYTCAFIKPFFPNSCSF
ncbi:hypothetical protein ILYODFUR_032921 [Ilyodon furcidens]|uniref:Uncharacterized protein n=1 Tax=Ilyodon furcidens TaxID=33524 RepID=A0ABV0UX78_9TELE